MATTSLHQNLSLGYGFSFDDLYDRDGLIRLDAAFLDFLGESDAGLRAQLEAARLSDTDLSSKAQSELLIALAPHLEDFLAPLFGIETQVQALAERHHELAPLYSCKRLFVQRRAMTKVKPEEAAAVDGPALEAQLTEYIGTPFSELAYARQVTRWLADETAHAGELLLAARYAAWAVQTAAGRERHHSGILFKVPAKLDFEHLVPLANVNLDGISAYRLGAGHALRRRQGFVLTDAGTDLTGALDQANYCIWCHEQGKDSCSKGLKEKPTADGGVAEFRKNSFGVKLAGCPLEEKISEFHKVKTQGHALAALAIIAGDNPMVAATGHRICNDCMKSCIYQKQQPVDIPQAETRTLKDVLELPWGFEIYSLLT